jgi:hypothetical protein
MGGLKTYFFMGCLAATAVAYGMDYIGQEKFMAIGTFFAALGGMSLRNAITTTTQEVTDEAKKVAKALESRECGDN